MPNAKKETETLREPAGDDVAGELSPELCGSRAGVAVSLMAAAAASSVSADVVSPADD